MDTSKTAGEDEQLKHVADDEGSNKEGGKGDCKNGDEGGRRATLRMVKKRARAARAMVTRVVVVGDKEGDGDGGNMARNNDDGLISL